MYGNIESSTSDEDNSDATGYPLANTKEYAERRILSLSKVVESLDYTALWMSGNAAYLQKQQDGIESTLSHEIGREVAVAAILAVGVDELFNRDYLQLVSMALRKPTP